MKGLFTPKPVWRAASAKGESQHLGKEEWGHCPVCLHWFHWPHGSPSMLFAAAFLWRQWFLGLRLVLSKLRDKQATWYLPGPQKTTFSTAKTSSGWAKLGHVPRLHTSDKLLAMEKWYWTMLPWPNTFQNLFLVWDLKNTLLTCPDSSAATHQLLFCCRAWESL